MSVSPIYAITPIEFRLDLKDPFIFCAHHLDYYPKANADMGPTTAALNKEYSMYYGETVPGFPQHPHTGFETITIVEQGVVDHFDSLGNAGRYAAGDVQWLTTGNGVEHCEMFPLLNEQQDNPLELFQIWFNSSPQQKQQDADYKMLWREQIPHVTEQEGKVDIRIISGYYQNSEALPRPPHSWSTPSENHVNIYIIRLAAHTQIKIPATTISSTRFCYFYQGSTLSVSRETIAIKHLIELQADVEILLEAGDAEARILWLEGEPIGAPVAMRGPFVLNSDDELDAAFRRYRETQFGGWPWPSPAPVFERDQPRFATYHAGEQKEYPEQF